MISLISKCWKTKKVAVIISVGVCLIAFLSFGIAGLRKTNEASSLDYYNREHEKCIQKQGSTTTLDLCSVYRQLITDTPFETQRYRNFGIYLLLIYFSGLFLYSTIRKKLYFLIGLALVVGFVLGVLWIKRSIWTGFYYSDIDRIDDQRTWIVSPPVYSVDECRNWVEAVHKEGDNYDYSCGQGCRFTTRLIGETMICRTDSR